MIYKITNLINYFICLLIVCWFQSFLDKNYVRSVWIICDEYIMEKINKWVEELHVLSEIANIEPQAPCTCFLNGYKHKFNYYMRTIPGIGKLLKVDEVKITEFIPAINGWTTITENERKLLSLAPWLGGLGKAIFEEVCEIEYQNSIIISEQICNCITDLFRRHEPGPELNNKKKNR